MRLLRLLLFILFFVLPLLLKGQNVKKDPFYIASWNIENLFDTVDDPLKDDSEFLQSSPKEWNEEKLEKKMNQLARVINYMNNGSGPDILAFQEVENINVVKRLIYKLKDRDYVVAHRESPDQRGIDVAVIYDRNVFSIDKISALKVELPTKYPTRDILHVVLIHKKSDEKIHIYANHWPSRRGGQKMSEGNRIAAAIVLKKSLDSLTQSSNNANIVILGDFNDNPSDYSIAKVLETSDFECDSISESVLLNLAYKEFAMGKGSYLFSGKFDMIDQIIISSAFLDGEKLEHECGTFEVIKPPFMVFENGNRKGGAIRTFSGDNYIGGFSDHFPVGAKFFLKANE